MMDERYITIREVSKIIGVTPLTLRNWDRKGVLLAFRNPVNNYRMYRYADVADFIAEMKKTGPRRGEVQKLQISAEV